MGPSPTAGARLIADSTPEFNGISAPQNEEMGYVARAAGNLGGMGVLHGHGKRKTHLHCAPRMPALRA
jgi:hypothetical protein